MVRYKERRCKEMRKGRELGEGYRESREAMIGSGIDVKGKGRVNGEVRKEDLLPNGLTLLQETFCRLVAQRPVHECRATELGKIYGSIPGVKMAGNKHACINSAYNLMKKEKIVEHINAYRAIIGTDRLALLERREKVFKDMWERFQADPESRVRAADVIQMLKDGEEAFGVNNEVKAGVGEIRVVLENKRISEGLKAIGIKAEVEEGKFDE